MLIKWSAIRESGRPGSLEARLRRFDGKYRWFLFQAEPLRDRSGGIVKWYGSATDIEDRKLAEFSLRESEQRFRDYAETASDWLWETGPDHRITRISEHINVVGFTNSSLPGATRWEVASDFETEPEKWRQHREMLDARGRFGISPIASSTKADPKSTSEPAASRYSIPKVVSSAIAAPPTILPLRSAPTRPSRRCARRRRSLRM